MCIRDRHNIYKEVQQAAYEIIKRKNATYYGIGLSLNRLIKMGIRDRDGTNAWVVGDVNNSGTVDDNDLTFYENYVGLKPVDNDWEYSTSVSYTHL